MPPYSGPSKERQSYTSKFVRVEEALYVTEPNDTYTAHYQLARVEGILDQINKLRSENPDEVDGGYLNVIEDGIYIGLDSMSLRLPVTKRARERTVEEFTKQSLGYKVKSK